jgi:hypothetical protein
MPSHAQTMPIFSKLEFTRTQRNSSAAKDKECELGRRDSRGRCEIAMGEVGTGMWQTMGKDSARGERIESGRKGFHIGAENGLMSKSKCFSPPPMRFKEERLENGSRGKIADMRGKSYGTTRPLTSPNR